MRLRIRRCAILSAALLLGLGCSKGPKTPTVPVSGTIKYKGDPVAQATVGFVIKTATEGKTQHPARGVTDDQGRYTLSTYINPNEYPGAPPGDYIVTVSKREGAGGGGGEINYEELYKKQMANIPKEGSANTQQATQALAQQQQPKSLIPQKYEDAKQSDLQATVKPAGAQTFDFELKD